MQREAKLSPDDIDRIPDWMSDDSGTRDVDSDIGSDGGWDMALEEGSDDGSDWAFGDD